MEKTVSHMNHLDILVRNQLTQNVGVYLCLISIPILIISVSPYVSITSSGGLNY